MSLNAATIEYLLSKGLTGDDLLAVAQRMEKRADSTNAERQARHRAKRAGNAVTVTRYPPNDKETLTPEELPQEAKASLPQGAKTKRDAVPWHCPPGVDHQHWQDFLAARKRKRCIQSQTALDGVLGDLAKIADDEWPPGRLVQHAAAKGWASINDPRKPMNGIRNGSGNRDDHPLGRTGAALEDVLRSPSGIDF